MTRRRLAVQGAVALLGVTTVLAAPPTPARAFNPLDTACGAIGWFSGIAGKLCKAGEHVGRLVSAGKKLVTGHVGSAVKSVLGGGGSSAGASASAAGAASTTIGLAAVGAWVVGGATFVLHETARVLAETTSPQLASTWFSSAYWNVAAVAAALTLPFLFAAAVQALLRGDIALLLRSALGYLPLAFLAVTVAAPLATLLLAASDQLSVLVSGPGAHGGAHILTLAGMTAGILSLVSRSPFLAFMVGMLTVAGAIALWLELLARAAAVYVVVLMLPLAFAALVWPARRVWAVRAVEVLVALILSKFAIVVVLSLGGAALGHTPGGGVAAMLGGFTLLLLGAFAPWVLLRLLPLAELAGGAAGALRTDGRGGLPRLSLLQERAEEHAEWVKSFAARVSGDRARGGPGGAPVDLVARAHSGDAGSPTDPALESDVAAEAVDGKAPVAPTPPVVAPLADAAPADAAAAEAPAADRQQDERLPGLGRVWQAPDMSWRPLVLGAEGWPPPELWPQEEPTQAREDGPPTVEPPVTPPREGGEL